MSPNQWQYGLRRSSGIQRLPMPDERELFRSSIERRPLDFAPAMAKFAPAMAKDDNGDGVNSIFAKRWEQLTKENPSWVSFEAAVRRKYKQSHP
jgi:hypothetical protein